MDGRARRPAGGMPRAADGSGGYDPEVATVDLTSGSVRTRQDVDGVVLEPLRAHSDHRGLLIPSIDFTREFWHEPVVYSYQFTVRPGRIKGFARHARQTDRYVHVSGDARIVLHDGREDSPTRGMFAQHQLSDDARGMLRIPHGVWHGAQCWGEREAIFMNFPTEPYDPANPDKESVDPHNGPIPFDWSLRDG